MRLVKLIDCDIYRDGGSIEGVWLTDENKNWAVTLKIDHWGSKVKTVDYHLYNCPIDETNSNHRIVKNSVEHNYVIAIINKWVLENNIQLIDLKKEVVNCNRLYDLLVELEKGNY
jgi:hypothetical protein